MPIRVPCPRCKHTTYVPDSSGGRLGRCKQCGYIIQIPLTDAQRKYCGVCRADISLTKRVKDTEGNYYCPSCWQARLDAAAATSDDFWNALEDLDRK